MIARPTLTGRLGTPAAPLANWTLSNPAFAAAGREDDRHPPPRADAEVRRAHVPGAGRASTRRRRPRRRVAYFHGCGDELLRAAAGRDDRRAARAQRHRRSRCPKQDCCGLPLQSNGLFDDARKYVHRLAARLAPVRARGRRHRRHVDELHADAQARGAARSSSSATTRSCERSSRARLRHLRVPARRCTSAASSTTDFAPCRGDRHLPRAVPAAGPRHRQAGARPDGAGPRAEGGRERRRRAAASPAPTGSSARSTRSRWTSARGCSARSPRTSSDRVGVRLRDLPLADPRGHRRARRAPGRDAASRHPEMVSLVIVSHSARLAEGVAELAARDGRRRGGDRAGRRARRRRRSAPTPSACARPSSASRSPDGVLVLMDLGSALMSAEIALEMLEDGGPVALSAAPLVEGAVAAAALARARRGARRGRRRRPAGRSRRRPRSSTRTTAETPRRSEASDGEAVRASRRQSARHARAPGRRGSSSWSRATTRASSCATPAAGPARPTAAA